MILILIYVAVCYVMGAGIFLWLKGERSKLAQVQDGAKAPAQADVTGAAKFGSVRDAA